LSLGLGFCHKVFISSIDAQGIVACFSTWGAESLAKFRICFCAGPAPVGFQKPGKVDDPNHKSPTSPSSSAAFLFRAPPLMKFFVELFENLSGILPIEAYRRPFGTEVSGASTARHWR